MKFRMGVAVIFLATAVCAVAASSDDVNEKKVERIVVAPRFTVVSPTSLVRGYLGVNLMNLTPELRQHFGTKDSGVMVSRVSPDGPAAKAGLQAGDVITGIDGNSVYSGGDIGKVVGKKKAGEVMRIDAIRDRAPRQFTATIEEHSWPAIAMPENFDGRVFSLGDWNSNPENKAAFESLQTFFKSPEWKTNVEELRDCARNEEKIKLLEERMQALERRLKEK
ncbi:MAG: PDZ domain-containing protein [Acidobacteriota bacterium]